MRPAVLGRGQVHPVPVHRCRGIQLVLHVDAHPLASLRHERRPEVRAVVAEGRRRALRHERGARLVGGQREDAGVALHPRLGEGRHAERLGEVHAAGLRRRRPEQRGAAAEQQGQRDTDRGDRGEARRRGARAPRTAGRVGGEDGSSRHASSLASGARMRHPAARRMRRGAVPPQPVCVRRPASIVAATRIARRPGLCGGSAGRPRRARGRRGRRARSRAVPSPVPPWRRGGEGGRRVDPLLGSPRCPAVAGAECRGRDRRPGIERATPARPSRTAAWRRSRRAGGADRARRSARPRWCRSRRDRRWRARAARSRRPRAGRSAGCRRAPRAARARSCPSAPLTAKASSACELATSPIAWIAHDSPAPVARGHELEQGLGRHVEQPVVVRIAGVRVRARGRAGAERAVGDDLERADVHEIGGRTAHRIAGAQPLGDRPIEQLG